ncbi:hypothetical protein ACFOSC_10640 [Streptantibioticus rubrisoli]|uniref:hypothetical protein n=1 Tax=Streptantibioticus rubrisoli TaxID=1387313 RepID=UPI003558AF8C
MTTYRFVVLPRRWKVERTIGWCMNARRNGMRLRTPAPTRRSPPELVTQHHDDPAPDPQGPPHGQLDEEVDTDVLNRLGLV